MFNSFCKLSALIFPYLFFPLALFDATSIKFISDLTSAEFFASADFCVNPLFPVIPVNDIPANINNTIIVITSVTSVIPISFFNLFFCINFPPYRMPYFLSLIILL